MKPLAVSSSGVFSLVWSGNRIIISGPLQNGCYHPPVYEFGLFGQRVSDPDYFRGATRMAFSMASSRFLIRFWRFSALSAETK